MKIVARTFWSTGQCQSGSCCISFILSNVLNCLKKRRLHMCRICVLSCSLQTKGQGVNMGNISSTPQEFQNN